MQGVKRKNKKAEGRARAGREEGNGEGGDGRLLVTRPGLARVLAVSLRTVDRMLAAGEIVPVRLRGAVRFYVPEVVESLRDEKRKWGRKAELTGSPKCEVRNSKESGKWETEESAAKNTKGEGSRSEGGAP